MKSPISFLTLVLLNPDISSLQSSVGPDQMASDEAIRSGSALFSMQPQNYTTGLAFNGLLHNNT